MNHSLNIVDKIYPSNNYGDMKVVEYNGWDNVKVQFLNTGYTTICQMSQLRAGNVRDKSLPSNQGIGIVGNKYPTIINGKECHEYNTWSGIIRRCYDDRHSLKSASYKDCTVSENFKSYEYFYEWCQKQIGFGNYGWQIDKDLLIKGNRVYSEDTCVFVPAEINIALINRKKDRGNYPLGVNRRENGRFQSSVYMLGARKYLGTYDTPEDAFMVYKQAKEQYLQHLAYKWELYIDPRAFEALLHYNVDIND